MSKAPCKRRALQGTWSSARVRLWVACPARRRPPGFGSSTSTRLPTVPSSWTSALSWRPCWGSRGAAACECAPPRPGHSRRSGVQGAGSRRGGCSASPRTAWRSSPARHGLRCSWRTRLAGGTPSMRRTSRSSWPARRVGPSQPARAAAAVPRPSTSSSSRPATRNASRSASWRRAQPAPWAAVAQSPMRPRGASSTPSWAPSRPGPAGRRRPSPQRSAQCGCRRRSSPTSARKRTASSSCAAARPAEQAGRASWPRWHPGIWTNGLSCHRGWRTLSAAGGFLRSLQPPS
mmetsp:Transcript_83970/g.261140  ORF Transcript_83970/g.261140 Transcript_83970/m.261140 type:complete len:290 (-) Transcript_83970:670-1539(-)